MALTALNTIKNWFKTNLIPTQQQFWDTLDSFRHKSDKVAATDVDGLNALLAAKASNTVFQAHTTAENAHAGLFGALRTWVEDQIAGVVIDSQNLGALTPLSVIPDTINVHGFAVEAGTYANCGGVVVPATSYAFISRVDGVWKITVTELDLTELKEGIDRLTYGFEKYYANVLQEFAGQFGYINMSGNIAGEGTDTNWKHTDFLRIKLGSTINYSGTSTPDNVHQVAFYDIEKNFVSGVVGGADGSIVVPAGVTYVRFCTTAIAYLTAVISATILITSISKIVENIVNIKNLDEDLNYGIEKQINGVFQTLPLTLGYINMSGVIAGDGTDVNWKHTDFLRVKIGSTVDYSGTSTPDNVHQVAFYDIENNFVSGVVGGTNGSIVVPDGVAYVRFTSNAAVASASVVNFLNLISLKQLTEEKINISDVQNILTSSETEKPGSAYNDKILNEKIENVIATTELKPAKNYNYDINHFLVYGQSLSQGDWEPNIVSNVQKYNSLMFTGGMRVWENRNQGTIYTALVPAVETAFAYEEGETVVGAETRGETPCSGMADKIVELIDEEDGFAYSDQQYQILVSAPGMGGTNIATLSDQAGIYYLRLLRDVTNGKRLAEESGKTYWCPAVTWIQGEADVYYDMSQEDYYNAMESLFDNLNTDIKAITGQTEDVHFFLYQTQAFDWYFGAKFTYPDVPLAQLQISLDKPNVHLATPIYHFPHIANDCHFTAVGSKWFGGYFGIAYKRVVIDKKPFRPINLVSSTVVGNNIYLKFEAPVYPLKFDTVNVVDRGISKGFQIRNIGDRAQNSFLNIITNVEINKYNTIKISCSSSPAGKKLTYAINGTSASDTSSGNLRDSQDIKFLFKNAIADGAETSHDMYNWCPIFETLL
jgi:hypothetical protein